MKPTATFRWADAVPLLFCAAGTLGLLAASRLQTEAEARQRVRTAQILSAIRDLDTAVRTAPASLAKGTRATEIMDDLLSGASAAEQSALRALQHCLAHACADAERLQRAAESAYTEDLAAHYALADATVRDATMLRWAGVAVLSTGVVALWLALARTRRTQLPPPTTAISQAGEDMLRQRLDALYSARLKAAQDDRFVFLGEVAAGLSHGLKTPLAGIRAAAQVAQAKLGREHAALVNLDDIVVSVDTLVEQVNRFLATPGGAPRLHPRDLQEFLQALLTRYSERARALEVSLVTAWQAPGTQVMLDEGLMEMALSNLMENALAVQRPQSRLEVRLASCTPPERAGLEDVAPRPGPWVEFSIQDQGPGMPREVAHGAPIRSQKPLGSGLGVALCQRIVARHGGALRFETVDGGGTLARVFLPVISAPPGPTGAVT